MKKLYVALLSAMMVFTITGCGSDDKAGKSSSTNTAEKDGKKDKAPLEIVESGYSLTPDNEYINYGIVIKNPNKNYAIDYPAFTITLRDENNKIIASEDQVLTIIVPGETIAFGDSISTNGLTPAKVEFKLKNEDDKYKKAEKEDQRFEAFNLSEIQTADEYKCTGEIKNLTKRDYATVAVTVVLYKDGNIVFGSTKYVDSLEKENSIAFEISEYYASNIPEHDTYKVFVQEWV